jgi:hypothetical protein
VEPSQLDLEHVAAGDEQRGERLVLDRRRHAATHGELVEGRDVLASSARLRRPWNSK